MLSFHIGKSCDASRDFNGSKVPDFLDRLLVCVGVGRLLRSLEDWVPNEENLLPVLSPFHDARRDSSETGEGALSSSTLIFERLQH